MNKEVAVYDKNDMKSKIYTIRGTQVMLDRDLARLYGVETKQVNRAVKRNGERFPKEFMFQLTEIEYKKLKSSVVTPSDDSLGFQTGTLNMGRGKHRKYLPYAFTEQGVAMLSGVLRSDTAIRVSIQIMTAFVAMRRFIASNAQIFQRLDMVEKKQVAYEIKTDKRFEEIFAAIESKDIKPEKGIFFNGQIFDAYTFISDLVRSAQKSIILIDNFVDDTVLTLFTKRKKNVDVTIFTKEISKELSLDLKKHNTQYPSISMKEFKDSHDRFMIIDDKHVYHIGASLKDVGKKWFAFSKFGTEALKLMEKLQKRGK